MQREELHSRYTQKVSDYKACASMAEEIEMKILSLRRKALSVAEQTVPLLEQYKKLRSPEIRVVSLKEFGFIRAQLREQTKLALSIRKEVNMGVQQVRHLKEKLPVLEKQMKLAEEALQSWSNVVPFRGNT